MTTKTVLDLFAGTGSVTKCFTLEQFLSRLTDRVARDGNSTTARALGVSPAYLSDVRARRKPPSTKLLTAMGYQWAVTPRTDHPTEEA